MLPRILVVVMASAVSAGWCSAQKPDSGMGVVEGTLMQMEKDWAQAVAKGRPAMGERMEAAEFVGTAPDGKVSDKAQAMSDVKAARSRLRLSSLPT